MARQPRIEFPGAVYYLVNRGDGHRAIFKTDADRARFLETLGEACRKAKWEVLAYALLPGQFHLVVRTPEPNLVAGIKWFLGTYTIQYNRRHHSIGHLFAGRYRSVLVDPAGPFLPIACHYLHQLVTKETIGPQEAPALTWSSVRYYTENAERPAWFNASPLFAALGLADNDADRARYAHMQAKPAPADPLWAQLRRGWCVGSPEFRAQMLAHLAQPGPNSAAPSREHARDQAELLLAGELQRLGWNEAELSRRAKGDPEKVRLARKLRQETTVSLRWVAKRLHMGSWTHAANCLYRPDQPAGRPPRPARPKAVRKVPAPKLPAKSTPSLMEELPLHCL